jgi:AraC-like DNA-binding protein
MNRSLSAFARSCGGELIGADRQYSGVSTDTRTLKAGELFVALRGPRFNANDFVNAAETAGAAGAVVDMRIDRPLPQILDALLRALLLHAERLVGEPPAPAALERFFTILERDHAKTRSVAHYAKHAGISKRRLGELLAARTGKSTKQVIDERVILELKRLLVHTPLTVKELAARAGFDEPTNLVKFFRNHTGTTPTAFRESHRTFLPSARRS